MSISDELKKKNTYGLLTSNLQFVRERMIGLKLTDGDKLTIQKLQQEQDEIVAKLRVLKMEML